MHWLMDLRHRIFLPNGLTCKSFSVLLSTVDLYKESVRLVEPLVIYVLERADTRGSLLGSEGSMWRARQGWGRKMGPEHVRHVRGHVNRRIIVGSNCGVLSRSRIGVLERIPWLQPAWKGPLRWSPARRGN